jgi:hypothetical protein
MDSPPKGSPTRKSVRKNKSVKPFFERFTSTFNGAPSRKTSSLNSVPVSERTVLHQENRKENASILELMNGVLQQTTDLKKKFEKIYPSLLKSEQMAMNNIITTLNQQEIFLKLWYTDLVKANTQGRSVFAFHPSPRKIIHDCKKILEPLIKLENQLGTKIGGK